MKLLLYICKKLNNMSKKHDSSGGVGVLGLLGVAFVILKLTGHINRSWWWVTLPFWGAFVIIPFIFLVFILIYKFFD